MEVCLVVLRVQCRGPECQILKLIIRLVRLISRGKIREIVLWNDRMTFLVSRTIIGWRTACHGATRNKPLVPVHSPKGTKVCFSATGLHRLNATAHGACTSNYLYAPSPYIVSSCRQLSCRRHAGASVPGLSTSAHVCQTAAWWRVPLQSWRP